MGKALDESDTRLSVRGPQDEPDSTRHLADKPEAHTAIGGTPQRNAGAERAGGERSDGERDGSPKADRARKAERAGGERSDGERDGRPKADRARNDPGRFSLEVRSDGRSFWLPAPLAWVMGGCVVLIAVLASLDPGRAGLAAVEAQADRVSRWERAERARQQRAVQDVEEPLRALRRRALERGLVPEGDLAATPCGGDPAAHFSRHAGEVARLSAALSAAASSEGRVAATLPSRSPIDLTRGEFFVVPDRELPGTVRVTSSRGPRADPLHGRKKDHKGVDISAPVGTPVVATADGTVVWAGAAEAAKDHLRSLLGTHVVVEHGETGFVTLYAHLSKASVTVGQTVVAGDELGAVGTTGRSTGPHLHYQVMRGGVSLDPLLFIADVVLIEDGKAVRWRKKR